MNNNDKIQEELTMLGSRKWKLANEDKSFDVWLASISNYLHEIFGSNAPQSKNFEILRTKFQEGKKLAANAESVIGIEEYYRGLASDYLGELIVQHKTKLEGPEKKSPEAETKAEKGKVVKFPEDPDLKSPKKHWWNMDTGTLIAAIAVICTIIGGAYYFGYQNASAKFDNEKNQLYEENRQWKEEKKNMIKSMKQTEESLRGEIDYYKSHQKSPLNETNIKNDTAVFLKH